MNCTIPMQMPETQIAMLVPSDRVKALPQEQMVQVDYFVEFKTSEIFISN